MQESWVNAMRSFENGSLKMEGHPVFGMPPHNLMRVPMVNAPAPHLLTKLNPERMYLLGDPRTNQNPAFLVMGIVFYRWHNYQVQCVTKFLTFTANQNGDIYSAQTITFGTYRWDYRWNSMFAKR